MQNFEEWDWYDVFEEMGFQQRNFNGSAVTNGFGLYYEIELLDTITNELKVDYFLQFNTVFEKDKPAHRVPLENGEKSLKAIREVMVEALEEINKYEPQASE